MTVYSMTNDVWPFADTRWTRLPVAGRSIPSAHLCKSSATKVKLVQVEVSASGINFLFIGVSRVIGNIAAQNYPSGSPDLGAARDLTSW